MTSAHSDRLGRIGACSMPVRARIVPPDQSAALAARLVRVRATYRPETGWLTDEPQRPVTRRAPTGEKSP